MSFIFYAAAQQLVIWVFIKIYIASKKLKLFQFENIQALACGRSEQLMRQPSPTWTLLSFFAFAFASRGFPAIVRRFVAEHDAPRVDLWTPGRSEIGPSKGSFLSISLTFPATSRGCTLRGAPSEFILAMRISYFQDMFEYLSQRFP